MSDFDAHRFGVVRIGAITLGIPIEHLSEVFPASEQTQLPNKTDLLGGGVELRGRLIPLLNIEALVHLPARDRDPRLGVVIEFERKLLAFHVSEILGITDIEPEDIHKVSEANATADMLFDECFAFGPHFVSVLDVTKLFELPGVFVADRPAVERDKLRGHRQPMMTFEAGAALYSVPAVEVYAAVPKQAIQVTAITAGPCLGEIRYHDRRIPVVCPVSILGLGEGAAQAVSEVVVLRFPDDLVVGLAVDSIQDIRTFSSAKESKIPDWQSGEHLIQDVFILDDDAEPIYSIDLERLRARSDVLEISKLSERTTGPETQSEMPERTETPGNVIRERERYLVVEAGERLAIPLLQVTCILDPPKTLTPAHDVSPGFKGYFTRLGETVALVDLRERMGRGSYDVDTAKVLLTGRTGEQVGVLVDKVLSIEVSQWREKESENGKGFGKTVVQLGSVDTKTVLPFLDLLAALCTKNSCSLPARLTEPAV